MSILQSTYGENPARGYKGMVANGETSNRITRTCEDADGIAFGNAVYGGSAEHMCSATPTLVGAGSEAAGNTGDGTITDVPTVVQPAIPGRYVITIDEPGTDAGTFSIEDPNGVNIGSGTVGTEYDADGLTFTVADGATDFVAGDQLFIDVTGSKFLGISIATAGQGLLAGETADTYQQYDNVPIMTAGAIFVEAGGAVTQESPAFADADGNFAVSGGTPTSFFFDYAAADGELVRIAKR